MADYLIYLIESSICLSILYLSYVFLFRKETYFNLIRIYLILSLLLAISIPLIHLNLAFSSPKINEPIAAIGNFKNYYEQIIYFTDPGNAFEQISQEATNVTKVNLSTIPVWLTKNGNTIHRTVSILLIVYIVGFAFFVIRFIYLLAWLFLLIRKHGVVKYQGLKLIQIEKEMPSFSFLGYLFVNRSGLSDLEFQQVIAHEKTHILQWHSIDLLIVNLATLIQWFNPLVWRLQKAFKTTHEYIADQKVVEQGYELLDYQSLLLRQLISIRSVELVNNFNLLSIKKRIAMMNKIKSKRLAKLKVLIIIPLLAVTFFLFADMTNKGDSLSDLKVSNETNITGRWIDKESAPNEIQMLDIGADKKIQIVKIQPNNDAYNTEILKYSIEKNTLEGKFIQIDYATASQVKELEKENILFKYSVSDQSFYYNGKRYNISEIERVTAEIKKDLTKTYEKKTILLEIDKNVSMAVVDQIKWALRRNNFLKIAYMVNKKDEEPSDKIYAVPNKLPPMDAKWLEVEEINSKGIALFKMNESENNTPAEMESKLGKLIRSGKKYVMLYEYTDKASYNEYIEHIDIIYSIINKARKEYALFQGKNYDELPKEEQNEIRMRYPITLTMKNVDHEE